MEKIEFFERMLAQRAGRSEIKRSYTTEEWYCANAYELSQQTGAPMLVFKEPFFGTQFTKQISDILALRNVEKIIIASPSTSLLDSLVDLQDEGWMIQAACRLPISQFEMETGSMSPGLILIH